MVGDAVPLLRSGRPDEGRVRGPDTYGAGRLVEERKQMSAEQRRAMHVNSLLAYYAGQEALFSKREVAVLKAIEKLRKATAREVMLHLDFVDMNSVRPRICELVKDGLLEESGSKIDPVTGKNVAVFALRRDPRAPQALFDFAVEMNRVMAIVYAEPKKPEQKLRGTA